MLIKTACSPAGMLVPRMGRRWRGVKKGRCRRSCHAPWRWRNFRRASSADAYCAMTVAAAAPAIRRECEEEKYVEHDVEHDGGSEIVQRTRRVAKGTQDGTRRVVEELCEQYRRVRCADRGLPCGMSSAGVESAVSRCSVSRMPAAVKSTAKARTVTKMLYTSALRRFILFFPVEM